MEAKLLLEIVIGHCEGMDEYLRKKVKAGERLFSAVSETLPIPFAITKRENGTILFANNRSQEIFGFSVRGALEKTAAGGTLLLDEIGDLSPSSQVKLLPSLRRGNEPRHYGERLPSELVPTLLRGNRRLTGISAIL